MFFSLAKSVDTRFPNHAPLGSWIVNHDNGWQVSDTAVVKKLTGSDQCLAPYTRLVWHGNVIDLEHSVLRGYPLWWDQDLKVLTNLAGSGERIWADDRVRINQDSVEVTKQDVIGNCNLSSLTAEAATDQLTKILVGHVRHLFDCTPGRMKSHFQSGGLDNAMIRACLVKLRCDFTALDYEHFEYDWFTNQVKDILRDNYWAYRQIHHWRDPVILLTGSCGDEYLMRGPTTIAIYCAWHDIDLVDRLQRSQGYHVKYFLRDKNRSIIQKYWQDRSVIQRQCADYSSLVRHICDINANDHQHWHLGNTFTWSPFHDLNLTKLMLSLDPDVLLDHFVDATVTKQVLRNLGADPDQVLGADKNLHARAVYAS